MLVKTKNFSAAMLARFLRLQRLSFEILEDMAATLEEGQTEKDIAHALVKRYREEGFTSFFHLPVVLFGERTALPGKWSLGKFFPKARALKAGDSVIFDAAPISRGYLVDTSYSFCFGVDPAHRKMMIDLSQFRDGVCEAVNAGLSFKVIAETVSSDIQAMGYEPVHEKHPGEVLGHRAVKLTRLPAWRTNGFDALSLGWFTMKGKLTDHGWGRENPLWNTSRASDHKPHDGLWLVEPHAGNGPVGAKWEEILVIEKGRARWLDETPPHVRQWALINSGEAYSPQTMRA